MSILSERAGVYVSGAELAAAAKVTRNAVWKAVNALVSGGADISRSHRGYMLRTAEVSEYGIKKRLPEEYSDAYIEVLDSVASTNTYMKGLAERAPDFSMTAAKEQTSGRGRYDRLFYSPRGSGVYFSVLLKDVDFERGGCLTALAAVAAAEDRGRIRCRSGYQMGQRHICALEKVRGHTYRGGHGYGTQKDMLRRDRNRRERV